MTVTRILGVPLRVGRLVGLNAAAVANAWGSVVETKSGRREREQLHPGRTATGPGQRLDGMCVDECWARLASGSIGRLAFTAHSGTPVIVPVNYAVEGRRVVIRSGRGPKLMAATRGAPVAFEVDEFDTNARTGWSVVVTGSARLADDPAERARLASLDLSPWAAGPRDHFVVVEPRHVAGRVLLPAAGGQSIFT